MQELKRRQTVGAKNEKGESKRMREREREGEGERREREIAEKEYFPFSAVDIRLEGVAWG